MCRATTSAIWSPTRATGSKAVIGSWKIMETVPPRKRRRSPSPIAVSDFCTEAIEATNRRVTHSARSATATRASRHVAAMAMRATFAALVASDAVVTVTQPTSKELEGISALEGTIAEVAEDFDKDLELGAIVPCIVPPASSGALYADAVAQLREAYGDLVTPNVRRSVKAAGAYSHREPLPVFAPREGVTRDYAAVLDALVERGVIPA